MRTATVALMVLSLMAVAPSRADVVELKTGQRVEGTFKQATPAGVVIEVGGQIITFEQEKVRAIYLGSPPQAQMQSSTLDDALKALGGLQSVVAGGVNYRDYAPRVSDAKIIVDRYIQEPERGDGAVKEAVAAAMRYYASAARAWSARLSRSNYEQVANDPSLRDCPPMLDIVEEAKRDRTAISEPSKIGIYVGLRFQPLWSCASDKIGEAERALKAMREGSGRP